MDFENINWLRFAALLLPVVVITMVIVWRGLVVLRFERIPGTLAQPSWRSLMPMIGFFLAFAYVATVYVALGGPWGSPSMVFFALIPLVSLLVNEAVVLTDEGIYVVGRLGGCRRYGYDDVMRVDESGKVLLRGGKAVKINRWDSDDSAKMFAVFSRVAGGSDVA